MLGYFLWDWFPPIDFYFVYWACLMVFAIWALWDEYRHREWRKQRDFEEAHRD